ncbi:hypothetical protein EU524_02155 [Candidatus Thorarchaeota archaeon]|jgi:hypothetical protein|nr:MAG: hypothetical protein EU524_02155 [Candidatus Thorarchaeota archaeon]
MISSSVECTALCKSFKCEKPSTYKIIKKGNKKVAWCTWIDEECDGAWCQYAKCTERRMLDNGMCKPKMKPAVEPKAGPTDDEYPDAIPKEYAKKLKGKL